MQSLSFPLFRSVCCRERQVNKACALPSQRKLTLISQFIQYLAGALWAVIWASAIDFNTNPCEHWQCLCLWSRIHQSLSYSDHYLAHVTVDTDPWTTWSQIPVNSISQLALPNFIEMLVSCCGQPTSTFQLQCETSYYGARMSTLSWD